MTENFAVDRNDMGNAPDDAALASGQFEQPETDGSVSVESVLAESETGASAPEPNDNDKPSEKQQTEPGWIRKRVETAAAKQIAKATADIEARIRAEYDAKFQPIMSAYMEREAQSLVDAGEFKSKERALEYLQLKNGASQPTQPNPPARGADGRFAPKSGAEPPAVDPDIQQRANTLMAQAKAIQAVSGLDVMKVYNENADVKARVLAGEWDFADVAKRLSTRGGVIAAVRTPNSAAIDNPNNFLKMTSEQFKRFDEALKHGKVVDLTK